MVSYKKWRWRLAQAAEVRWWQWYLRGRDRAAYLERKRAYWHRVLAAVGLPVPRGARVLDAGCGPAGIFLVLPECEVVALDPLVDAYAERLPAFRPADHPWVSWRRGVLEELADQGAYDLIFCLNAINHVADLELCLDNLVRALRPGGTLLLGVDVHRRPALKRVFRLLPGDVLHPQQHSLVEYQDHLAARNLRVRRQHLLQPGAIFNYVLLLAEKPTPEGG